MQIIFSDQLDKKERIDVSEGIGVALGNFDGLHIGHMRLIQSMLSLRKKYNLKSMVYTFEQHPENIIAGKLVTPLLISHESKVKLLKECGLDYLYLQNFDKQFMNMSAEEFVKKILVEHLKVKTVSVGFNYRFGHKGLGNIQLLEEMGKEYHFIVDVLNPVQLDGTVISSSTIRKLILQGNVELASKYMGRDYAIEGTVVHGKKVGNKMGFPTANLIPNQYLILPSAGVYLTKTIVHDQSFNSITNVGSNPTFNEEGVHIETYILDFNADLYGQDISIHFLKKIREEKKFNSFYRLLQQIKKDVQCAKEFFYNM